jgi:DNA-binding LytR/AlgR family response regulator
VHLFLKNNKKYIVEKSIEEINSQLDQIDPAQFFRVTRQYIVNITPVGRLTNWLNRKIKMILSEYPHTEIVISKEKVSRV